MITLRHPFANTQFARYSLSTDALTSWLRLTPTDPDVSPGSAQPRPPQADPPPRRQSFAQQVSHRPEPKVWPKLEFDVPEAQSKSSSGHFVKHSSRVTLLLSGQANGATEPEYTNGATIEGILAVPRPSGLLALQVKVSRPRDDM